MPSSRWRGTTVTSSISLRKETSEGTSPVGSGNAIVVGLGIGGWSRRLMEVFAAWELSLSAPLHDVDQDLHCSTPPTTKGACKPSITTS